ncbi:hypothetical protein COC42_15345 [Sphingomonas spermidinifaciens]|uniref:Dicarboxylate/amino acid:cation symporter n=1 Tax=Sphingomonas spermidinifaciens TaxID=1141889 RepID=A0A2A4B2F9_9SPHN|nr:hypothetical protein COC42_15345 [Sphingomonas spermidinifaciens]
MTAVGEKAAPLLRGVEALAQVILQVTNYVMRFAPLAVFAAVAGTLAERGAGIIGSLAYFMGTFYLGMGLLWLLLIGVGFDDQSER